MELIPIESIKDISNKLAKNYSNNLNELEYYRDLIIKQKNELDNINSEALRKNMNDNIDNQQAYRLYEKILNEKEKYSENTIFIDNMINRRYANLVTQKRKFNKSAKIGIAVTVAASLAIGSLVYVINKKNDGRDETPYRNEYRNESTTEMTTQTTTEMTTEATTEKPTEATTEMTTQTTTEKPTEATTEKTTETVEFDDDLDFSKFEKVSEWVEKENSIIDTIENTLIDDSSREEAKETAKNKIIEYTDFIFYGTEIDGKTFDELTEEEKSKIYTKYQELINTVNEYDPNYINSMSEKYKVIKDFGSLTLNNAKEKIKETVGDEYYNSAGEAGEAVKEGAKDTGSLALEFIKKKYEDWRDNTGDE